MKDTSEAWNLTKRAFLDKKLKDGPRSVIARLVNKQIDDKTHLDLADPFPLSGSDVAKLVGKCCVRQAYRHLRALERTNPPYLCRTSRPNLHAKDTKNPNAVKFYVFNFKSTKTNSKVTPTPKKPATTGLNVTKEMWAEANEKLGFKSKPKEKFPAD